MASKTLSEVDESGPIRDKVVLVGDVGVGKTSLFLRFKTDSFKETTSHNPREGEFRKEWIVGGTKVSMTMFDTAGIERHMTTIPPTYFRWSKVVMLVYSIDDSDTFDSLTGWSENAVSARVGGDSIFVLVGNKSDLGGVRKVEKSRALQYAMNIDIDADMVFEVSAMTGEGFNAMLNTIGLKMGPAPPPVQPDETHTTGKQKSKCC